MPDFELDGWRVAAGSKKHQSIGGVTLSTGTRVEVPCVVVKGAADGPTLVVSGCTHGQELVGTGAVLSLVRSLQPPELRGTVIGLPVMNPLAMQTSTYVSPQDGMNMASPIYWPGDPSGTITERLGVIIGRVLERADLYIDIHGNFEPSFHMSMMFLEESKDEATTAGIRRLADAFGVTPVDMSAPKAHPSFVGPVAGYPAAVQASRGVPALMVELTSSRTLADADRGARGLRNVMREFRMLDSQREQEDVDRLPGSYQYWGALRTDAWGLMWPRHAPGTMLTTGEVIFELTDVFGEPVGEVVAPVDGFSWGYIGSPQGFGTHAVPEGSAVGFYAEKVS